MISPLPANGKQNRQYWVKSSLESKYRSSKSRGQVALRGRKWRCAVEGFSLMPAKASQSGTYLHADWKVFSPGSNQSDGTTASAGRINKYFAGLQSSCHGKIKRRNRLNGDRAGWYCRLKFQCIPAQPSAMNDNVTQSRTRMILSKNLLQQKKKELIDPCQCQPRSGSHQAVMRVTECGHW